MSYISIRFFMPVLKSGSCLNLPLPDNGFWNRNHCFSSIFSSLKSTGVPTSGIPAGAPFGPHWKVRDFFPDIFSIINDEEMISEELRNEMGSLLLFRNIFCLRYQGTVHEKPVISLFSDEIYVQSDRISGEIPV